jgi:phospholipase D1/2
MTAPPPEAGASLLSLSFHRLKRHPRPLVSELPYDSIFHPGRNIALKSHAARVAFLIDADAYFRAFTDSILQAEKQVFILGWDIDTRVELPMPDGSEITLGDLLVRLAKEKPELQIYILSWDFAFIYLFERESLPSLKFAALSRELRTDTEDRLHFVLDHQHPFLASHHQKVVVIDDKIAFSGGLDLTQRRWDTPEHRSYDERRVDPGGHVYGPFHDLQICVEGEIARELGQLSRQRWRAATGESIMTAPASEKLIWPSHLAADVVDVEVGLARTQPGSGSTPQVTREVERLFLDSIRSARHFVYIENQYFTSPTIAKAIARRLSEANGPEFVMVLPRDQTGWIEESTMGLLRSQALRTVERADRYGRFRAYYPVVPGLHDGYVKVHSKVMIVDDVFVRVGSANLNGRSMGMDTECDLAFEAAERGEVKDAIGRLRSSLLGEHLGIDPIELNARFLSNGSLLETVESFRGGERTLVELRSNVKDWMEKVAPPREWIDPQAPLITSRGIRRWFANRVRWRTFGVLALIAILAISLWADAVFSLEGESLVLRLSTWFSSWNGEKIAATLARVRGETWVIPAVLGGFVFGSIILIPITAMIVGVGLTFPPVMAFALAMGGSLLASWATYGVGRFWAGSQNRFPARPWMQNLAENLRQGGFLSVAAIRMTPIAPFSVVGYVAGGLRIPVRNYLFGSFLGLAPGIFIITVASSGASQLAAGKEMNVMIWISVAVIVAAIFFARRRIQRNVK